MDEIKDYIVKWEINTIDMCYSGSKKICAYDREDAGNRALRQISKDMAIPSQCLIIITRITEI